MNKQWRGRVDNNNPCRDCKDRHLGCHSKCQSYLDWKEDKQMQNADDRKRREINNLIRDNETKRWKDIGSGHKGKGRGRR